MPNKNIIKDKKILMIYSKIPWPLVGGDRMRVYYLGKILATKYKVDLLCINEGRENPETIEELKKFFHQVFVFSFPKISFFINAFLGFFSKKPLQVHCYYFKKIQKWINKNIGNYDIVFCNHIRTTEYVKNFNIKKIIDFHDALSKNYKSVIKIASGFKKIIYFIENKRLLNYELEILKKFELALITSLVDRSYILNNYQGRDKDILIVPMGVKEELLERKFNGKEENWLTFLGAMTYTPNEDAVLYFTKKVFPKIQRKITNINFYIIGGTTKKILALKRNPGIIVTELLNDPYYYLLRSKIVVAPVRQGTGIQNKVLEGMALGKTVVTTPVGASGIPEAKNGEHFIVINPQNPDEMANKIIALIESKEERKRIGDNAKKLILENYTWETIGKILLENICKL